MQSSWLDERVSEVAERVARPLSRRGMLKRAFDVAFKGSLIAVLGLADARKAFADTCNCEPARGQYCSNCPPAAGACPAGYSTCKKINGVPQDTDCVWSTGAWDETCVNGNCRTCIDCWTGVANSSCTCRSPEFSCGGGGGGGCEGCASKDCGDCSNCCGSHCCI